MQIIFQTIQEEKPIHTLSMNGMGTFAGHLPPAPIVGPPLAGLASLGFGPTQKEWDQLSMYSQRTDRSATGRRLLQMERGGKFRIDIQRGRSSNFLLFKLW